MGYYTHSGAEMYLDNTKIGTAQRFNIETTRLPSDLTTVSWKDNELKKIDRKIKQVIFNDPATIIIWKDGTKTVVKTQDGEAFDPEKGFTMGIMKYLAGNKSNFNNVLKKWIPEVRFPIRNRPTKKRFFHDHQLRRV